MVAIGEDATSFLEVLLACNTSVLDKVTDAGRGCTHCTEVPCQLCVASTLDTIACDCKISISFMDTTVEGF